MPSFNGEFRVLGTKQDVYDFLSDPHCLVRCIPDVKAHEIQDADHFTVTLQVGVGRLRGQLNLAMEVVEKEAASRAQIAAKGSMLKSPVNIAGDITLADGPDGATLVTWSASARVGAYLLQLVGGMLDGLVKQQLSKFVEAVEREMALRMKAPCLLSQDEDLSVPA